MAFNKTIQREIEVAFSKQAQPLWFRVVKWIVTAGIIYFFWNSKWLWVILIILFVLSLSIHFWFRYKTNGWTKSYSKWKHETDRHKVNERSP
ncbi:MAG: hypothetical protein WDO19_03000 [Bacteroidota bacterium]